MQQPKPQNLKEEYFVLRVKKHSTRDLFRGHFNGSNLVNAGTTVGTMMTMAEPLDITELTMEVEEAKRNQVATLANAHDVVAVALAMPMRLIEPVAKAAPLAAPLAAQAAWGLAAVGAHTSPYRGSNIVVAVLDTGIDAGHDAFAGVKLEEKDFTGEGNGDQHGHGTHCAGTIFGQPVNGVQIGIAPGIAKALIGKVIGKNGGSSVQIARAIQWAAAEGAHVISMSLGIDFPGLQEYYIRKGLPPLAATSLALEGFRTNVQLFEKLAALVYAGAAFQQTSLLIAAAGNESNRPKYELAVSPPAVAEGIISVGALQQGATGLAAAPFSNTGPNVSAPGVDILSAAAGGGYQLMSGTSMATPHVAGIAALWCEKYYGTPQLTPKLLTAKILGMAESGQLKKGYDAADVGAGVVRAPQ